MANLVPDKNPDLMTVHEFANAYRVDVSVVRGWVKRNYIGWKLVGPRMMVRVSSAVRPATPTNGTTLAMKREQLAGYMLAADPEMGMEAATEQANLMDPAMVDTMLESLKGVFGA